MKSLMRDIERELRGFLESERQRLLVVSCPLEQSALLLKTLEGLEEAPDLADIFITLGHPFADVASYVATSREVIVQQCAQASQDAEKLGSPLRLPSPPEPVDASPPVEAYVALLAHVRGQVPLPRRVVWLMFPPEVHTPDAYLEFVTAVREALDTPTLTATKLIVRDTTPEVLAPALLSFPDVRVWRPDLSAETLMRRIEALANDSSVPQDEQAMMHMMLASRDMSERRFDLALARNGEVLAYFQGTGQLHHVSVVQNNIGDIWYLQGRFPEAQAAYEEAVLTAAELKSSPLLIYQSINLGNALAVQEKPAEALVYYQAARQLAAAERMGLYELQACERMGAAHELLGDRTAALEAHERAVSLSEALKHDSSLEFNLARVQALRDSSQGGPGGNSSAGPTAPASPSSPAAPVAGA